MATMGSLSSMFGTPPKPGTGISAAGQALGLGDQLRDQVTDETEEARKRRLAQQQFSPAGSALLGLSY